MTTNHLTDIIDDNQPSVDIIADQLIMDDPASYQPQKSAFAWPVKQDYLTTINIFSTASLILALGLWIFSLQGLEPLDMTDLGLLSLLPYTYYIALALLIISLAINITHKADENTYLILAHFLLYIGMLHATPAILYGTLRYGWAWKHVGVVDFIQRNRMVDPLIHNLNAYHNWPGFFTFNALLTELAGYETALDYALWGSVVANLLNFGAMLLFARALTDDRRLMWLATWLLFIINWVGQDYFAPQSMAFFMHLVILGVSLTWFRMQTEVPHAMFKTWVKFDWLARWINPLFNPHPDDRNRASVSRKERASLLLVVIVLMASTVSVHQLTPFMTILTLGLFVAFRRINARMVPILMAVLTVTWVIFVNDAFFFENLSSLIKSLGALTNNIDSNLTHRSESSAAQVLVSEIGRGLTVGVVLLAIIGGLRRWWNGRLDMTPALLVLAPFLMMVGNSYGGEMIFRVYLFSVPAFAFLIGALVFPTKDHGQKRPWLTTGVIILLSGVILTGFLFPYYGKDKQFYFTDLEREATTYLFERAPDNSLLVEGSRLYPTQYLNYEKFTFVAISREPADNLQIVIDTPVEKLGSWLDNSAYNATYIIFTRSQLTAPDKADALLPPQLMAIQQALRDSPEFKIYYENEHVTIMTLATQEN